MKKISNKIFILSVVVFCALAFVISGVKLNASAELIQQTVNYVSLGDSIAAGYGLSGYDASYQLDGSVFVEDSYAKKFADYLKTKYSTVNASSFGVSGDTVSDLINKVTNTANPDYSDLQVAVASADIITICIGANNILGPAKDDLGNQIQEGLFANVGSSNVEMQLNYVSTEQAMDDGLIQIGSQLGDLIDEIRNVNAGAKIIFLDVYNPYYNFMDSIIAHEVDLQVSTVLWNVPIDISGELSKSDVMQLGISANTYIEGGTNLSNIEVNGLNNILYNTIYATDEQEQRLYQDVYLVGADESGYLNLNGIKKSFEEYELDYADLINATILNYDSNNPFVFDLNDYEELALLIDPHPTAQGHQIISNRLQSFYSQMILCEEPDEPQEPENPDEPEELFNVFFISDGEYVSHAIKKSGEKVLKPQNIVKDGYFIGGWKIENSDEYWDFDNDVVTQDVTLVAEWKQFCTITFNSNGGTSVGPMELRPNSKIPEPQNIVRDGYLLVGWKIDGSNNFWNFETGTVSSDLTLNAEWKQIFVVQFDTIGGSDVDSVYIEDGEKVTAPKNVTNNYMVLLGWKMDGSEEYWNFESDTVADNITLKAVWTTLVCKTESNCEQELTVDAEINGFLPIEFEITIPTNSMQWYVNSQAQQGETNATFSYAPPLVTGTYEVYCVINGMSTYKHEVRINYGYVDSIKIHNENIYSNGVYEVVVEYPELYDARLLTWIMVTQNEDGEEKEELVGSGVLVLKQKFEKSCKLYVKYEKAQEDILLKSNRVDVDIQAKIDPTMPVFVGMALLVFVGITILALISRRRYDKY